MTLRADIGVSFSSLWNAPAPSRGVLIAPARYP